MSIKVSMWLLRSQVLEGARVFAHREGHSVVGHCERSSLPKFSIDTGLTWQLVIGPGVGPDLGRIVFGYGLPESSCPR